MSLEGAFRVDLEPSHDERGYFARTWCQQEAARHDIFMTFVQSSVSHNKVRGTLRGLHFQRAPHAEAKLVRCLRGTIFDVLVDLRRQSPTFRRWEALELSSENGREVFIPAGIAHGFLTLSDDALIGYDISTPYEASATAGIAWNDPDIGVAWPHVPAVISSRDAGLPRLAGLGDGQL